jgi:HAD superfamily hydrolase (TIGR01509 family)
MGKTELVIFDHDGLMVNTEDVVYAALTDIFREHDIEFTWDYYCTTIGLPVVDSLRLYLRDYRLPLTFEEFQARRNTLVGERLATSLQIMPGLPPLLEHLRSRGVRMAIATSGTRDYIERNLVRFGLAGYFEAVACIDDVARGKPHPDLVLKALELTGTAPADAVMLEDAPHGVEAAHRAGVFCVAVPTRGIALDRFAAADVVARDLPSVLRLLEVAGSRP